MTRAGRLLAVPATLVAAWLAGFAWFVVATRSPGDAPPRADGIVVLTGGAERVSVGLHLLAGDAAGRLLVSGVGRAAELPELARRAGIAAAMFPALAPRVTLGHAATSTRGNALETADWVAAHHVGSLIVVTAGYHMPRALWELRRRLRDVVLYPVPVQPPGMRNLADASTWRLLAGEYTKYLVAVAGLTDLAASAGLSTNLEEHGG